MCLNYLTSPLGPLFLPERPKRPKSAFRNGLGMFCSIVLNFLIVVFFLSSLLNYLIFVLVLKYLTVKSAMLFIENKLVSLRVAIVPGLGLI